MAQRHAVSTGSTIAATSSPVESSSLGNPVGSSSLGALVGFKNGSIDWTFDIHGFSKKSNSTAAVVVNNCCSTPSCDSGNAVNTRSTLVLDVVLALPAYLFRNVVVLVNAVVDDVLLMLLVGDAADVVVADAFVADIVLVLADTVLEVALVSEFVVDLVLVLVDTVLDVVLVDAFVVDRELVLVDTVLDVVVVDALVVDLVLDTVLDVLLVDVVVIDIALVMLVDTVVDDAQLEVEVLDLLDSTQHMLLPPLFCEKLRA